jgi:type IV/VI secretion system ImpK/VasF family protein
MTLVECCEPLFQTVCRLNRSARKGVGPEMPQVRSEIKGVLAECRARADQNQQAESFAAVEDILLYFVDFMVRASALPFAARWQDLAQEKGRMAGDEDFFDRLDATLRDASDAATERLAVFYICMGLGFTGWYAGQPDVLRKKMLELSSRLRGRMDADRSARICPEAYEHVNTRDMVQPPAQKLVGVAIVLAGIALTMFAANIALYLDKQGSMKASLKALTDKQAQLVGPAGAKGGGR